MRVLLLPLMSLLLAAPFPRADGQLKQRDKNPLELPPSMEDEDEDRMAATRYVFNPIQARKELKIGKHYGRKGNQRAAAARYLEATLWDPGFTEAYWHLGRAREKLKQHQEALDAYRKFLALEPDGKKSKDARKKTAKLEKKVAEIPVANPE